MFATACERHDADLRRIRLERDAATTALEAERAAHRVTRDDLLVAAQKLYDLREAVRAQVECWWDNDHATDEDGERIEKALRDALARTAC